MVSCWQGFLCRFCSRLFMLLLLLLLARLLISNSRKMFVLVVVVVVVLLFLARWKFCSDEFVFQVRPSLKR